MAETEITTKEAGSALVPKLRFPEFRGEEEWTTRRLGDFLRESRLPGNKGNVASKITVKLWGKGVFEKNEAIQGSANTQYYRRKAGQFIYSKLDFLNQAFGIIPDHLDHFETTVDLPCFDIAPGLNPVFLLEYVKRKGFYQRLGETADGSRKARRIHPDVFLSFPITLPPLPEQQKVAACLSSLDELIAAQAQKVEGLKTHKKGMMQQLFPREGETQPHLRFPEFQNAGEWEPTTLGSVARLRNGYAFKSAEYVADGLYQIITIANVQQGNLTLESTKRMAALPPDIQKYQVLDVGDILISMTGNVGRVCLVTAEGLLLNQRVGKLVPDTIETAFFFQLLQRDVFRNTMQLKAAGGAQGNLSVGDITEYVFKVPADPAEQQRIATCLSSLDALITAENQKLEALKTHKKGLIQHLFPSTGVDEP